MSDQTLDTIPTNFEEAREALSQDPRDLVQRDEDLGFAEQLIKKLDFLTSVVVQNEKADRTSTPEDEMSVDFRDLVKVKLDLFKSGHLPSLEKEQYNEIARRQTKLHPAVETKTNFFG